MTIPTGACLKHAGSRWPCRGNRSDAYTLLGFMLVAFGLTVVGIVVATNLVGRFVDKSRRQEEKKLARIRGDFFETVTRTQTIPTYTNWLSSLVPFASTDQTGLNQTHPEWGSDASLNRAFLVDTNLPPSLLPYRQSGAGLTGAATNLLGTAARVMIVSSTKRGLSLPVSSGVLQSNAFNAIWNWTFDPSTKAPPSGWGSSWNQFGEFLHVDRINLANFFHTVTCKSLLYGMGTSPVTNLVASQATFYFLHGTSLVLALTNGTVKRAHVVTRDVVIDFSVLTNAGPLLVYHFTGSSGLIATNSGSTGASANGIYTNGVTLGSAGPGPPTYTNYSAGNTAITLDGVNDYVRGTNGLLNNLSEFTIAGWIKPSTATMKDLDLFGQLDLAQIGFTTPSGKLELWCDSGSKKLHYFYPYGAGEWHHIAGVGDGATMKIYVDAVLVASRVYQTTTYGSNANCFNVGGNVFGTGQYFPGTIDEVIVYGRALSAAEVAQLYANQTP